MGKIKKNKFFSGCIPSPDDERDYPCCMAMEVEENENLPREFEVWTSPVANQLASNCVGQAIAAVVESQYHKTFGNHEEHSVGYIYGNRMTRGGSGQGMVVRTAMLNTVDYGDVAKSIWEYEGEVPEVIKEFNKMYPLIKDKAFFPFGEIVRIRTINELKRFIAKYGIPVVIRMNMQDIVPMTSGNHAMIVYGWDWHNDVKIQNSWDDYCDKIIRPFDKLQEIWGFVPMEKKFTDIENDAWYADAVKEASDDGVLNGYPDGTFKPEKCPTRAELATFWLRIKKLYAEKK